jgi:ubiquitin-like protein Pup
MAMRIQMDRKTSHRRTQPDEAPVEVAKADSSSVSQKLVGDMDEILEEIDAIIEQNAEEFVAGIVQKGGE